MVGLLLVAGVALLLTSVKGAEASATEEDSTEPSNALKRTKPGFLGGLTRGSPHPIPPKNARVLGIDRVSDPRYDAKGGLALLKEKKGFGFFDSFANSRIKPAPAKVSPGRVRAVMQPSKPRTSLPSRFRVPLMASSLAVKVPTVQGR